MTQLVPIDLHHAVTRLPPIVRGILQFNPNRSFLAGGYIRSRITGEKVSDIDLFSSSKEEAKALAEHALCAFQAAHGPPNKHEIWETENAFSIKGSHPFVQFIHRWTFEDPVSAIDSFDFTIAKAAIWYDGKAWLSVCHPHYYADLAAKRLLYCSPVREEEAGGSLLRVLKFYQRGYRIPLDSLAAVLARMESGIDGTKIQEMALHPDLVHRYGRFPSREETVQQIMLGLLREVDPLAPGDEDIQGGAA